MSEILQNQDMDFPDPCGKELYRLGFIACAAFPPFILFVKDFYRVCWKHPHIS